MSQPLRKKASGAGRSWKRCGTPAFASRNCSNSHNCRCATTVAPTTGTLVPLLHIVPSKTDCERLIPMSPELVQVLLAVLRRAKAGNDHVPLSIRYDTNEKLHGEPFPHLFVRRIAAPERGLVAVGGRTAPRRRRGLGRRGDGRGVERGWCSGGDARRADSLHAPRLPAPVHHRDGLHFEVEGVRAGLRDVLLEPTFPDTSSPRTERSSNGVASCGRSKKNGSLTPTSGPSSNNISCCAGSRSASAIALRHACVHARLHAMPVPARRSGAAWPHRRDDRERRAAPCRGPGQRVAR